MLGGQNDHDDDDDQQESINKQMCSTGRPCSLRSRTSRGRCHPLELASNAVAPRLQNCQVAVEKVAATRKSEAVQGNPY